MILWRPYYDSIEELPLYNWLNLNKGEYRYLLKPFYFQFVSRLKETEKRKERWFKLYDEYIEKIGITDDYKELLQAMKRHGDAICAYMENPNTLNKVNLQVAELGIQEISSGEKGKFSEFVAMVEKYLGFQLNLKEISVERFYAYVELIKKDKNG